MFDVHYSRRTAEMLRDAVGMQDFSRLVHICHYVLETQNIEGDIVEFGCHVGQTARLISSISTKDVHVYDSFEGLPDTDERHGGEMKVSYDMFLETFNSANVRLPKIIQGWFNDIKPEQIPNKISFAHLDGDLYDSTIQSLNLIYDRLSSGGVILVDDYKASNWPGVERAVTEFFENKPETVHTLSGLNNLPSYKAMIRKL